MPPFAGNNSKIDPLMSPLVHDSGDALPSFSSAPFVVRDSVSIYVGNVPNWSSLFIETGGGNWAFYKGDGAGLFHVIDGSLPLQWLDNSFTGPPPASTSVRIVQDDGPQPVAHPGSLGVGLWNTMNTTRQFGVDFPGPAATAENNCILEFAMTADLTTILARMRSRTVYTVP